MLHWQWSQPARMLDTLLSRLAAWLGSKQLPAFTPPALPRLPVSSQAALLGPLPRPVRRLCASRRSFNYYVLAALARRMHCRLPLALPSCVAGPQQQHYRRRDHSALDRRYMGARLGSRWEGGDGGWVGGEIQDPLATSIHQASWQWAAYPGNRRERVGESDCGLSAVGGTFELNGRRAVICLPMHLILVRLEASCMRVTGSGAGTDRPSAGGAGKDQGIFSS